MIIDIRQELDMALRHQVKDYNIENIKEVKLLKKYKKYKKQLRIEETLKILWMNDDKRKALKHSIYRSDKNEDPNEWKLMAYCEYPIMEHDKDEIIVSYY